MVKKMLSSKKVNKENKNNILSLIKLQKRLFLSIICLISLAILLIITFSITQTNEQSNTPTAITKALNFISEKYFKGSALKLLNFTLEDGIYGFYFDTGKQVYNSYVTLSGNLLLLQGVKIEDILYNKTDIPIVKLFVMSYCPYGNIAEESMIDVIELLGNKIDFRLYYIIEENKGDNNCLTEEQEYCSMHGKREIEQDLRELCIQKYYPDKYYEYLLSVNKNCSLSNITTCWDIIAIDKGIDVTKIKDCQINEVNLLDESKNLCIEYDVLSSPTIIINNELFVGAMSSNNYKELICKYFINRPTECNITLTTNQEYSGNC